MMPHGILNSITIKGLHEPTLMSRRVWYNIHVYLNITHLMLNQGWTPCVCVASQNQQN